jgi:CBS domain-containing membrane protein
MVLNERPATVADVMTRKVIAVGEHDTLERLEESMERFRFRHLPVVDGKRLIGLVTHRDLLHVSSSFLSDQQKARDVLIHRVPVGRIMHTEMLTVAPEEPLFEAAKLMWEAKVGCLPVVQGDDLVGIITEADFLRVSMWFLTH